MTNTQTQAVNAQNLLSFSNYDMSYSKEFIDIVIRKTEDYDRNGEFIDNLKSFLEELRYGGCISGMISEFIYNSDTKEFYINHLDDLESFLDDLEDGIGERIENKHELPRYTFLVWLAFEEFCNNLYNRIFEY